MSYCDICTSAWDSRADGNRLRIGRLQLLLPRLNTLDFPLRAKVHCMPVLRKITHRKNRRPCLALGSLLVLPSLLLGQPQQPRSDDLRERWALVCR